MKTINGCTSCYSYTRLYRPLSSVAWRADLSHRRECLVHTHRLREHCFLTMCALNVFDNKNVKHFIIIFLPAHARIARLSIKHFNQPLKTSRSVEIILKTCYATFNVPVSEVPTNSQYFAHRHINLIQIIIYVVVALASYNYGSFLIKSKIGDFGSRYACLPYTTYKKTPISFYYSFIITLI